jgi:hypothetical protein
VGVRKVKNFKLLLSIGCMYIKATRRISDTRRVVIKIIDEIVVATKII